jgi:hypothetical protein
MKKLAKLSKCENYRNLGFETHEDVVLLCPTHHAEVGNHNPPVWSIKNEDLLVEMYNEGKSVQDISEKVDLTVKQIKSKIYNFKKQVLLNKYNSYFIFCKH